MVNIKQTHFKLHSTLADSGFWPFKNHKGQVAKSESIRLWYYLRSQDSNGAGWGEFSLDDLCSFFDRSIYTIRRWIKWGVELGLFRAVIKLGNKYRVYYSSLVKVCLSLEIDDLGAIAQVEVERLKELKFAATEATALRLQNQSRHKELSNHNHESVKSKVIDPDRVLSSELGIGAILARIGRFTFLKNNTFVVGVTQQHVARTLNRHPTTVQRRLSNSYRQERGINQILKTQLVARPLTDAYIVGGVPSPRIKPGQRIIRTKLGVFRLAPNIYKAEDLELASGHFTRWRLAKANRAAAIASELDQSWKLTPEHLAHKAAFRQSEAYNQRLSVEKIGRPDKYWGGQLALCMSVYLLLGFPTEVTDQ